MKFIILLSLFLIESKTFNMNILSKIHLKVNFYYRNLQNRIYSFYLKHKLKDKNFSIICNNCYGGHLYEVLQRPYNTPTVGLYFFAEDYLKFISNLNKYLNEDLMFLERSRFEECQIEHEKLKYPIGVLSNNLEIHFLHYKTPEEARAKWNRRKKRLDYKNLLIMMNDQNGFTDSLMGRFDEVEFPKIFFSSQPRKGKNVKFVSYYSERKQVGDMYKDRIKILGDFNIATWILRNLK